MFFFPYIDRINNNSKFAVFWRNKDKRCGAIVILFFFLYIENNNKNGNKAAK